MKISGRKVQKAVVSDFCFGYAVTVEGGLAALWDYVDRHLGSPLQSE